MQQSIKALALAVAMALSGAAFAADPPAPGAGGAGTDAPAKKPARTPGVRGKVTSTTATTIVVTGRAGEKTITVDGSTKYTVDDKPGTLADVKEGMFVSATPETGPATDVKISTKAPTRKPKPAADQPAKPADPAK